MAGTGGSGASSFARFKYRPKGGPDGGDGGHGGNVFVRADPNLATLLDYRYRTEWKADRGEHGKGKTKTGASTDDIYLPVPPGTLVLDADTAQQERPPFRRDFPIPAGIGLVEARLAEAARQPRMPLVVERGDGDQALEQDDQPGVETALDIIAKDGREQDAADQERGGDPAGGGEDQAQREGVKLHLRAAPDGNRGHGQS